MADNPDAMLSSNVADSTMRGDLAPDKFKETSANEGQQFYALSIATVTSVDYAKLTVGLRTQTGESIRRLPIPITFPGAGARHFLGALPQPGDECVVGWGMLESGRTRVPWIVSWLVPGSTAGYDWLPTQPFAPDESDMSPSTKYQLEGMLDRVRHKLRHMEPGNIVASSAQGADVVLTESVFLANRRGNEIHLRDQDQALIVRSLQQFHAGAGFRIYGGMVQRDATFLPTQMFSDGIDWASARQQDGEGNSLAEDELAESLYPTGYLTPATVFQRDNDGNPLTDLKMGAVSDPYEFLQRGLFISEEGYAYGIQPDAIYGGKPMFRVSTDATNGITDTAADTFTEYRIEVSHTSDGTLPVTEQTDGFDANRLPSASVEDADPLAGSIDAPFVESVLGTVVGNDPYSNAGREVYGIPLRPVIFDQDTRSPTMTTGLGTPVETHAATLLKVTPPVGAGGKPTFWSVTKDGRLMVSLVGPGSTWSSEMAMATGLKFGSGAEQGGHSIKADLEGAFVIRSERGRRDDNLGVYISSDQGAVKIYAGGKTQEGAIAARVAPAGDGESELPGLILESATNTLLKAAGAITISASQLNLENVGGIKLGANNSLDFQSGAGISHSSNTSMNTTTGQATYVHSGPKDSNPTNGPLRRTSFTGSPATGFTGGTADEYELLYGDRQETLTAGNHETEVLVGNMTYQTQAGTYKAASGPQCSMELNASSATTRSPSVTVQATGGSATLQASSSLSMQGATASLNASNVSVDGGHTPPGGTPGGGVLTDGVLDPLTGSTFNAGGVLGIPTFRVN